MGARIGASCFGAWLVVLSVAPALGRFPVAADAVTARIVDRIELNHLYSDTGTLTFSQYVFLEWSDEAARYESIGYAFVQYAKCISAHGVTSVVFNDDGYLVKISASEFCETWTQYDRETDVRQSAYCPRYSSDGHRLTPLNP